MVSSVAVDKKNLVHHRWKSLVELRNFMAPIMDGLSFLWLLLTIIELTRGLTPILEKVVTAVWGIFVLQFLLELFLAPQKKIYLKHNLITVIALIVPAFRILRFFRFFRFMRFVRGTSLVKIFASLSRGMKSLQKSLATKVLVYVLALTLVVIVTAAAGILSFEKEYTDYFHGFGSALWWSGMMVTTMGSDYFPKSPEGRILGFSLAVYGFAIFGYVAASIGSFFLAKTSAPKTDRISLELQALREEIASLKESLKQIR